MPGENREKQPPSQTTSGGRRDAATAASPSKTNELERTPPRGGSMIPLPRTTPQNPKTVKTEKNRLRLIMENKGLTDTLEKERRIDTTTTVDRDEEGYRVSCGESTNTMRHCDVSCNPYRCPSRKVILSVFLYCSVAAGFLLFSPKPAVTVLIDHR
ncbi:PREDICTED: uncharacterized protein LOC107185943 [Dufourea novaeangliae]|uniref:uncharacterized protein LOC107185943 n=1 Tax=Dufourea novaeangliae TaxID=178035 RepID=UPI000766E506|nr:PREDICTED: uncharacterized protein LOC107185943 [Dufourea novaeangliae]